MFSRAQWRVIIDRYVFLASREGYARREFFAALPYRGLETDIESGSAVFGNYALRMK